MLRVGRSDQGALIAMSAWPRRVRLSPRRPIRRCRRPAGRTGSSSNRPTATTGCCSGSLAQTDGRFSLDTPTAITNTFAFRKVRPTFSGRVARYFDFKVMPDFGNGTTTFTDAYIDMRFSPKFRIRAGKDKTPVGLRAAASATPTCCFSTARWRQPACRTAMSASRPRAIWPEVLTTRAACSTAFPTARSSTPTSIPTTARTWRAGSSCGRSGWRRRPAGR